MPLRGGVFRLSHYFTALLPSVYCHFIFERNCLFRKFDANHSVLPYYGQPQPAQEFSVFSINLQYFQLGISTTLIYAIMSLECDSFNIYCIDAIRGSSNFDQHLPMRTQLNCCLALVELHSFFYRNLFHKNTRLKTAQNIGTC